MGNEDESAVVVFNGEIYNHLISRKDLEAKGHVFRTRCDTEVLVYLYEGDLSEILLNQRGLAKDIFKKRK